MCKIKTKINEIIKEGKKAYKNSSFEITTIKIDWKKFNGEENKNKLLENLEINISNLSGKPCIYFFEFDKNEKDKIYEKFSIAKAKKEKNSNVLYVGKVKNDIGGRLYQHFFYESSALHLISRAKEFNITLYICCFKEEMANFMTPVEFLFAQQLKPIIGTHRS